jgi:ribosomal protein S12 methylthiotransferase
MKTRKLEQDKVQVITLGCSKNLVDSENMITQLRGNELEVTHQDERDEEANVVIVNTCGFIDLAKEESVNTILEYAEIKKQGGLRNCT